MTQQLPQYLIPCKVHSCWPEPPWALVHLWFEAVHYEREYNVFDQRDGCSAESKHSNEHLDAACGEGRAIEVLAGEVTRHHCAPFPSSLAINTTTNTLYSSPAPLEGPRPPPHISFLIFTAVEIFKCCHVVSYRHFEEQMNEVEWGVENGLRGGVRLNLFTSLLSSQFTCCKLWLASVSHTDTHTSTADHHCGAIRHGIYFFFSKKKERGGELPIFVQFFSGPHYIPTFLKHGFNILMGIDEYNYIRIYVC